MTDPKENIMQLIQSAQEAGVANSRIWSWLNAKTFGPDSQTYLELYLREPNFVGMPGVLSQEMFLQTLIETTDPYIDQLVNEVKEHLDV